MRASAAVRASARGCAFTFSFARSRHGARASDGGGPLRRLVCLLRSRQEAGACLVPIAYASGRGTARVVDGELFDLLHQKIPCFELSSQARPADSCTRIGCASACSPGQVRPTTRAHLRRRGADSA